MDKKMCKGLTLKMLSLAGMVALFSFPLGSASATTVTNLGLWQLAPGVPPSGALTYIMPAGVRPDTGVVEPVGDWVFSQQFGAYLGTGMVLKIPDPNGVDISDYIIFSNTAPGTGNGRIRFFRTPPPPQTNWLVFLFPILWALSFPQGGSSKVVALR